MKVNCHKMLNETGARQQQILIGFIKEEQDKLNEICKNNKQLSERKRMNENVQKGIALLFNKDILVHKLYSNGNMSINIAAIVGRLCFIMFVVFFPL